MTQLQKACRSRGDEAHSSKELEPPHVGCHDSGSLVTELLILPDGRILVHNLTRSFAGLLAELNPDCEQITSRLAPWAPTSSLDSSGPASRASLSHELSD